MSEKCPIIAIDPGNRQSAYCVIDCNTLKPLEFGKVDNEELRNKLVFANEQGWQWAVIEMVASYGMAVGREVFDTVLWIGRFYEALSMHRCEDDCTEQLLYLCRQHQLAVRGQIWLVR